MAAIFLFFSVISGVLTLRREAVSEYQLYSAPHVKLAEYIEEHTATDAVILTNRRHNNEVASLTGRNLVCGADTFLYFHGIDTTSRQKAVCEMYENPASNQHLFEEYNVSYIVVSSWERSSYAVDESALQELFELEVKIDDICLYKVK